MKNHRLYFLLFASLACFSYPIQAQQGPDDLWEISSIIMKDGMRMLGGPNRVCTKKDSVSDKHVPVEDDCRVSDRKSSGNRVGGCTAK